MMKKTMKQQMKNVCKNLEIENANPKKCKKNEKLTENVTFRLKSFCWLVILGMTCFAFVGFLATCASRNSSPSSTPPPTLTSVFNQGDDSTLLLSGATSVTTAVVGPTTFLFASGFHDNGVSVFSVSDNGALTSFVNQSDDDITLKLRGAASVTTAVVGNRTFLFVAGLNDNGVSVFSVANNGMLTSVANQADDNTLLLRGATSVATVAVGRTTYLFVAGFSDDGVSVFSVANNGTLTSVFNQADDETLLLNGASSVTTAVVGRTTYLFVAGNGNNGNDDNGVSVFSVANNGVLTSVFNQADDITLKLGGATSVTSKQL